MSMLDEEVKSAIRKAVQNNQQQPEVGQRIEAWIEGVLKGNTSLNKPDDYKTHLEETLNVTKEIIVEN